MSVKLSFNKKPDEQEELDAHPVKKATKKSAKKKATKKKAVKKTAKKKRPGRAEKYKTPKALMGIRNQTKGKKFEGDVAKFTKPLHGIRVGGQGDNELRKVYDVYGDGFVGECKHRKKISMSEIKKLLDKGYARHKDAIDKEGKVFILFMEESHKMGFWIIVDENRIESSTSGLPPRIRFTHSTLVTWSKSPCIADLVSDNRVPITIK